MQTVSGELGTNKKSKCLESHRWKRIGGGEVLSGHNELVAWRH